MSTKKRRKAVVNLFSGFLVMWWKPETGEITTAVPTIGFHVEQVEYKNITFSVWDLQDDQTKIRPLWRHYYQNVRSVIFVVDSNNRSHIDEAASELQKVLHEDELHDAVLLIFANKQDLPNAMSVHEVKEKLGLDSIPKSRKWYIQASCATSGDGLYEGLDWLSNALVGKHT